MRQPPQILSTVCIPEPTARAHVSLLVMSDKWPWIDLVWNLEVLEREIHRDRSIPESIAILQLDCIPCEFSIHDRSPNLY
jgi:hypothetical protein